MKCLMSFDGIIMSRRYRDKEAAALVKSGAFSYCSKELWKEKIRDAKKTKEKVPKETPLSKKGESENVQKKPKEKRGPRGPNSKKAKRNDGKKKNRQ